MPEEKPQVGEIVYSDGGSVTVGAPIATAEQTPPTK